MFVTVLTEDPCIDVLFDYVSSTTEFMCYDEVKTVCLDSLLKEVIVYIPYAERKTFNVKTKKYHVILAMDMAMKWAYDIVNTTIPFSGLDYNNKPEDIKKEYDKSYNTEVIVIVNALIMLYYLIAENIPEDRIVTSIAIEQPDVLYVTCQ